MKAYIEENGTLVVKSESTRESYLLRGWSDRNIKQPKSKEESDNLQKLMIDFS